MKSDCEKREESERTGKLIMTRIVSGEYKGYFGGETFTVSKNPSCGWVIIWNEDHNCYDDAPTLKDAKYKAVLGIVRNNPEKFAEQA